MFFRNIILGKKEFIFGFSRLLSAEQSKANKRYARNAFFVNQGYLLVGFPSVFRNIILGKKSSLKVEGSLKVFPDNF